ncbi:ABC transporter permease [Cumulibacter manganitolerans]|uniref:ABC transporter permease n=1 Tax=Cumulibacter manganitolerans TaxID=1884992 RepID=UPI0012969BCA|nr:ABC transporter permease [Cumulibacter manganitolerans]
MKLIKSELRKFFTTKTWIWLLIGCVVLALVQASLMLSFAGTVDDRTGRPVFPPVDSPELQKLVLAAPASATIFIAILGVIGMTAEYRHKTMAPTFLVSPHRWQVVLAKLVTYLLLGVAYAVVAAVFVVGLAWIWIAAAGGDFTLAGDNGKVLAGAAIAAALYGIIGVSVGALARNQIGAVSGLLAYMFVIEPILRAIPATGDVYRMLPGGAASALYTYAQVGDRNTDLLSPVGGGLLLAAYAAVLALVGYLVSTRREVS